MVCVIILSKGQGSGKWHLNWVEILHVDSLLEVQGKVLQNVTCF